MILDTAQLFNLCWPIPFPFVKQLNTDFRLVRHLDLFGFNHFLGKASPQWVASCDVCLETWMMCHQSSEKSCFTWFENPIIQIWLANSWRTNKTTQVVDISQNWDFGTSIVFLLKHMMDLAEVATFRFSSGIFGTSCCTWIQSARELLMMSIVAGQCSCSQFTSTCLQHTVILLIVETIRDSNQNIGTYNHKINNHYICMYDVGKRPMCTKQVQFMSTVRWNHFLKHSTRGLEPQPSRATWPGSDKVVMHHAGFHLSKGKTNRPWMFTAINWTHCSLKNAED